MLWEAAAIFCPELDEAFPNHDAKIRIFSVTAKFQVADKGCFQQKGMREEEKGGGPAMESQGTGAGGEARGGRGGAILVNKAKNIE